ncbi:MAG: protein BatD, partial [Gemmatimonadetes bacterium]|nr:protein BatD [Gemmatimonadota bacterium]
MVNRTWIVALLSLASVAAPTAPQSAPRLVVGARPTRVRGGDTFVLTARMTGAPVPEALDVEGLEGAELVDVKDRTSASLGRSGADVVLERDFVLRALRAGSVAPSGVYAAWGPDTLRAPAPEVTAVGSAVAWARPGGVPRRERDDPPVRDEGRPPLPTGRDADRERAPQGLYPPYGAVVPTGQVGGWPATPMGPAFPGGGGNPYGPFTPYGPSGWGVAPSGQGWAPTAASDPWWPEMIPRLERYQTSAAGPGGLVRLEAGLAPDRVYVGQQLTLVATATFAPGAQARLGSAPEFIPPSAGGAWVTEIPYAPPTPTAAGGQLGEAHTFMRAFFPVEAGRLMVAPARLRYGLGTGGSAARPQEVLSTEALSVEVMPVPAGEAPPGWSGAVGRYRVAAWVQPTSVAWGEAALLTVDIAGAGNVRDLPRPDPGTVWGAELRPTGERAWVEVRDGVV